jgi:hypothetical protein
LQFGFFGTPKDKVPSQVLETRSEVGGVVAINVGSNATKFLERGLLFENQTLGDRLR